MQFFFFIFLQTVSYKYTVGSTSTTQKLRIDLKKIVLILTSNFHEKQMQKIFSKKIKKKHTQIQTDKNYNIQ